MFKLKFYSVLASALALVAVSNISVASAITLYQPEIPEELQ